MNCYFTNPVDLGEGDFEYSQIECETPEIYELIQNENYSDREFYIQKTLTYGEAILIWFLTIFFVFLIAKTIFNLFWEK